MSTTNEERLVSMANYFVANHFVRQVEKRADELLEQGKAITRFAALSAATTETLGKWKSQAGG